MKAQFVKVKNIRDYVKTKNRRISKELVFHLDVLVQNAIDGFLKANSLKTLRP